MRICFACSVVVSFLLAAGLAGANNEYERTKVNESMLWQRSSHHMASVEVNNAAVGRLLAPLLSYKFLLPMIQLRAGLAYAGSRMRLRRFVHDLLQARRPLKIGAVGGSVTWGQGASNRTSTAWFSVVGHWLSGSFANVTVRNGAVPATPASYMILCLDQWVEPDVDLVFVEYILNNGFDRDPFNNLVVQVMERLIRRLLDLPGKPAVVLMQIPTHSMASYNEGFRFYETMEDLEGSLAQYYDVQYLSLRTALYRLAAVERQEGFRWDQTFMDHHPGDAGNRVMADLVAYLLQDTALDLLLNPLSGAEMAAMDKPLPPPMYRGNTAPASSMCLIGERFLPAVVAAEGFEYVNEGSEKKPRWGYVATAAGARLVMHLDTRRPLLRPEQAVGLYVHVLKSYEHMGIAELSCTSGCQCEPVQVDAHITEHWSQMYHVRVRVGQSEACEVTVRVLDSTSSGEHKFKVSGAVISEDDSSASVLEGTADTAGRLSWDFAGSGEAVRRVRRAL